jgi:uncharacterized protein YfdQ (DUF2303 family)
VEAELLEKALATGSALGDPKKVDGALPFAIVPEGYSVQSLEHLLQAPTRIKQNVSVFDTDSFIKYFTDYCTEDSRVFVDRVKPQILGVIDYHAQAGEPDWTSHRVSYVFRNTVEWQTWASQNKVEMTQTGFARFIEDNLPDIVSPDSATMLEISRTFEAKKGVTFHSATRLQNHEIQFQYDEEIRGTAAKGTIEIPDGFDLSIAPFEGSDYYKVTARFRYKFGPEGLKLRYELLRPHKVLEDAVNTVVLKIRGGINNPITFGSLS